MLVVGRIGIRTVLISIVFYPDVPVETFIVSSKTAFFETMCTVSSSMIRVWYSLVDINM